MKTYHLYDIPDAKKFLAICSYDFKEKYCKELEKICNGFDNIENQIKITDIINKMTSEVRTEFLNGVIKDIKNKEDSIKETEIKLKKLKEIYESIKNLSTFNQYFDEIVS